MGGIGNKDKENSWSNNQMQFMLSEIMAMVLMSLGYECIVAFATPVPVLAYLARPVRNGTLVIASEA